MKDVILAPGPQSDWDGLEVTKNDVNQSITNSITNDEDDCDGPRKSSEHSIVNSVTNDEDDWIESRTNSDGAAVSILPRPCNYQTAFLTSSTRMNSYMDEEGDSTTEEPRTSVLPSASIFKQGSSSERSFNQESFMIRYEHMMKEQEMEQISTLSHVQSLLGVLEYIQPEEQKKGNGNHTDLNQSNKLLREFSFEELKQLKKKFENLDEYDIIKIDKQFLMVLEILCEDKENTSTANNSKDNEEKISWAEIIQCYRNCILGMQTLEIIGPHAIIRKRAKERILAALSLYREPFFADRNRSTAVSSRVSDAATSNMTLDDNSIISPEANQRSYQNKKPTVSYTHILVSFITGVIVAAILFRSYPSTTEVLAVHRNIPLANTKQSMECPIVVNEFFSSAGENFEVQLSENTAANASLEQSISPAIKVTREQLVPSTNEPSTLKKSNSFISTNRAVTPIASARTASDMALFPSDFSQKATASDLIDEEDHNDKPTMNLSNDLKVASMVGGGATVVYFLSSSSGIITALLSWLPMGMTVTIATLSAHVVRDVISGIWRKLRRNSKKRSKAFT